MAPVFSKLVGPGYKVIHYGDPSDVDDFIAFLMLVLYFKGDIIYVAALSKAYNFKPDTPIFEKLKASLDNEVKEGKLKQSEVAQKFKDNAISLDKIDFNYVTEEASASEVIKKLIYTVHTLYTTFNREEHRKLYIISKNEHKEFFFFKRQPFGVVWKPDIKNIDEPVKKTGVSEEELDKVLQLYEPGNTLEYDFTGYTVVCHVAGSSTIFSSLAWRQSLSTADSLLFIAMCGVEADKVPTTMSGNAMLIRDPLATMNQVYDPEAFDALLKYVSTLTNAKLFVVTNNRCREHANFTGKGIDIKDFVNTVINLIGLELPEQLSKEQQFFIDLLYNFYTQDFKRVLFDLLSVIVVLKLLGGDINLHEEPNAFLLYNKATGATVIDSFTTEEYPTKLAQHEENQNYTSMTLCNVPKTENLNPPKESFV